MAKKFFTSDWHINGQVVLSVCNRPFSSVDKMNKFLIRNANQRAKSRLDMIIHCGDAMQSGKDRGMICDNPLSYEDLVNQLNATFIAIKGNHDSRNNVKCACESMKTTLGSVFGDVVCAHYPSNHLKAKNYIYPGLILLHGHCHNGVLNDGNVFYIDRKNKVLNVNVCCELWKYQIIPEEELINKIKQFLSKNNFFCKDVF